MRELIHKEQALTSFQWKPYTNKYWEREGEDVIRMETTNDPNSMCPYCKNSDTIPVTDKAYLNSYASNPLFEGKHYKVFSCHCCNAIFSWWKHKEWE